MQFIAIVIKSLIIQSNKQATNLEIWLHDKRKDNNNL